MVYKTCTNCGLPEDECLCCPKCGYYDMCDCPCYFERQEKEAEKAAFLAEQREAAANQNKK